MSLECPPCCQWSMSQDYPKQCTLRQYLWPVSSLPWGRGLCNEFLIWGYFSFFPTGSSFAEEVWIHCWGDIFCSLYVFGGLFIPSVLCQCKCFDLQSLCDLTCFLPVAQNFIFWGCNICVTRSFRMVYREPERCLTASRRSERLTHWSFWTLVAIKPVETYYAYTRMLWR